MPHADEHQERDRRTVEAIARLYRKEDVEPPPALFDDVPTVRTFDQMERYVEIMGRRPLHDEEDQKALRQKPRRQKPRRR